MIDLVANTPFDHIQNSLAPVGTDNGPATNCQVGRGDQGEVVETPAGEHRFPPLHVVVGHVVTYDGEEWLDGGSPLKDECP